MHLLMNILGLQEESEISRHHKPSTHVTSHPKYWPTTTSRFSGFGIFNCFGGYKENAGWNKLHMVEGLNAVIY